MTDIRKVIAALSLAAAAGTAHGAIVSGTITGGTVKSATPAGQFVQLDPAGGGFAVGKDNFSTNNLYSFNERQNVTLLSDLAVFLGDGHGTGSIAAGTLVSSHFFDFDTAASQTVAATLVFDQPILGFARSSAQLGASNGLGMPQVTYNMPAYVGLEPGLDFLSFNPATPKQVKIFFQDDTPGDVVRVITAGVAQGNPGGGGPGSAVPEPEAWALLLAGFFAAGSAIRRKRHKTKTMVT